MVCYLLRGPLPHAVDPGYSLVSLLPSLLPFGMTLTPGSEERSTIVKPMILNNCSSLAQF